MYGYELPTSNISLVGGELPGSNFELNEFIDEGSEQTYEVVNVQRKLNKIETSVKTNSNKSDLVIVASLLENSNNVGGFIIFNR